MPALFVCVCMCVCVRACVCALGTTLELNTFLLSLPRPPSRTCFYALCLISKTMQGANVLLELGWTSVQHSPEDKWPLNVDQCIDVDESAFDSSPVGSPMRRFTFAPYIGTTFDLSSPNPQSPASVVSIPAAVARSETLPSKVAGSKSFAENLGYNHSSTKDPNHSEPDSLKHYSLGKSESSASLFPVNSALSRCRRSNSRRGSSKRFYRSMKERSVRSHAQTPATKRTPSTVSQKVRHGSSASGLVSSPEVRAQRYHSCFDVTV